MLWWFLLLGVFGGVWSKPLGLSSGRPSNFSSKFPSGEMFGFMKRYGYLEEGPDDAEALYTEEYLVEVIKNVQKFGALPQTGTIDDDTLKLISSPRCGVPDVIRTNRAKRFILGSKGWKKRRITYFIANWSPNLGQQAVRKNIRLALDTWAKYGRLTFEEVNDPNADMVIAFGSGYHGDSFPFDGPGNILAHAFYPYDSQNLGGDVHFDNEEDWTDKVNPEGEGTHFFTVAVHEIGHALGLAHSPVPDSVMFPYYRGNHGEGFALGYDDILGMYELYIKTNGIDEDERMTPVPPTSEEEEDRYGNDGGSRDDERKDEGSQSDEDDQRGEDDRDEDRVTTNNRGNEVDHTISYEGDYETVDKHKERDKLHGIPPTNSPTLPDICQGYFDAVATLRQELFVFKDQYIWRLREKNRIEPGYPVKLHQMFPKLPKSIKSIDAAYERPDGAIILFTGRKFWVYDGNDFQNSPRPLSDYGLPKSLGKVDAVQSWAKNHKTYFYSKDHFWRYNETAGLMDPGYPKHIERWRGVPSDLDAATTWKDGVTYFFKGNQYWKFDNDWIIVTDSSPMPSAQTWLGCPKEEDFSSSAFQ